MSLCNSYDPNKIFERFEVVEFPLSYVGFSTSKILDINIDLEKSAYIKTLHKGKLMKFEEARNISSSHRAFNIKLLDDYKLEVIFAPTNECIYKAKKDSNYDNRFVFDLRLITINRTRCCNNELHSEIGRYYISGQFEYCQVYHLPEIVNFGDVIIHTEVTNSLQIYNNSNSLFVKLEYCKIPGFKSIPTTVTIPPNSSKEVHIKVKPNNVKMPNTIYFKIINPYSNIDKTAADDIKIDNDQFIMYNINVNINVTYIKPVNNTVKVESLHKLFELNPQYAYTNQELSILEKRKTIALEYLKTNSLEPRKLILKRRNNLPQCISTSILSVTSPKNLWNENFTQNISIYDLFNIQITPFCLDFGNIAIQTNGKSLLSINNYTQFEVSIEFLTDECITYTNKKKPTEIIKLKAFSETNISVYCFGNVKKNIERSFNYIIQDKYYRRHFYSLNVSNPRLTIKDNSLKLGMVTPENFTFSIPLTIYNDFNVPIEFEWIDINHETPVEINPEIGVIPPQTSRVSEIIYVCKAIKSKVHELNLVSNSDYENQISVELSIITKKLSIKFLQPSVIFKDIPLNLEINEKVKMENLSREIALFHVMEQPIPGISVEPMNGIIHPKEIMTFTITVKIPCPLEFGFDICVKINNKENIILPVSGNIVEPKIGIYPKHIHVTQIPCNMIAYVPIIFQNVGSSKTVIELLDSYDDEIFNVYSAQGSDTQKLKKITIEGGQTKTIYIKVYDNVRRQYEMYMPFRINDILGPPNSDPVSTELRYYIMALEELYENNPKIKLEHINKAISFCYITGVITSPWIILSKEKFVIEYVPNKVEENTIDFTMTNVSKCILSVTILTSKLQPNFTLNINNPEYQICMNETEIKFELGRHKEARFSVIFHPKGQGQFSSVALMYLDKNMTIPYYNLSFLGINETPKIIPSTYRIIFPPCIVGEKNSREITLTVGSKSSFKEFNYSLQCYKYCSVNFIECHEILTNTVMTVEITIFSDTSLTSNQVINFHHNSGSVCNVEVCFCITNCPITLHVNLFSNGMNTSYPYYPKKSQYDLYEYMERCTNFLENWMFQQGFHRDLYSKIPSTFHAISTRLSSQPEKAKSKGNIVSYLSFIRRIVGPLMKHIHKKNTVYEELMMDSFMCVKEIHDTYQDILSVLKSCGANIWILQAKFLLSYEQFLIYTENIPPKSNADVILAQELIKDVELFDRLNKQSWIDFLLQSYKVFIMDNCFSDHNFNTQSDNIIKILIDWYNENIAKCQWNRKYINIKVISNITTDLSDGIGIISTILNYCPYMEEHFSLACKLDVNSEHMCGVNNACLIIGALNTLKIYFPLNSNDLLESNFLQMLFLSIHLYVSLPMFKSREVIYFNSPLLKSSSRQLSINSTSQEHLTYSFILINNNRNNFMVEKINTDVKKKMSLNVKYVANFVETEEAILLIYGHSRTQIFDTYIVFSLYGRVSTLNPLRKYKVTGTLYKPDKVDILIASPLSFTGIYDLYLTNNEPTVPVTFEENTKSRFYIQRLNLIDKEIFLTAIPKELGESEQEHKLYLQIICLNTIIKNSWIWFRSEKGEFFIKITTHTRWDTPIDTLYLEINRCPLEPCRCEEECQCERTANLMVPHHNELMLKSMRLALCEHASEVMMEVFDRLIITVTGRIILAMLLEEGGTTLSEIQHILRNEIKYKITSSTVGPQLAYVSLDHQSGAFVAVPITLTARNKFEKNSITLTSDCGMDIRVYKIMFIQDLNSLLTMTVN